MTGCRSQGVADSPRFLRVGCPQCCLPVVALALPVADGGVLPLALPVAHWQRATVPLRVISQCQCQWHPPHQALTHLLAVAQLTLDWQWPASRPLRLPLTGWQTVPVATQAVMPMRLAGGFRFPPRARAALMADGCALALRVSGNLRA